MMDLLGELEDLEAEIDDPETRERVQEVSDLANRVRSPVFGRVISGFDRTDASEAFLGSMIFGIPMMVEGGTLDVGVFLSENPTFLAGTYLLTLVLVWGVLYVADIQDVRVKQPLLGVIPRRFTAVLVIGLVAAVGLTTAWGRVTWTDPLVGVGTVAVAYLPMALGGALGDILPGS